MIIKESDNKRMGLQSKGSALDNDVRSLVEERGALQRVCSGSSLVNVVLDPKFIYEKVLVGLRTKLSRFFLQPACYRYAVGQANPALRSDDR